MERYKICMVSDFFFPNIGGVEEHIYHLSQVLLSRGHKVVVVTHNYDDYNGIRYLKNGLKVYYLPTQTFYKQATLPTVLCQVPLLRSVLLREQIQIVHGHSAFSTLSLEAIILAKLLGIHTVFTDHSLFGFSDLSALFTNGMLSMVLSINDLCICVSHVGKENTVARAGVSAEKVYVIPNAVDTVLFSPDPDKRPKNKINIIVASRLVYRKGIDLLAKIMPMFKDNPEVNFIICGDGPKRYLLEEIREKFDMHDRIEFLGSVEHAHMRDILVQGHIFLNTSLTEAFCMAIVEAAACGLQVVTTNVGGIPEVLPPGLNILVEPNAEALCNGIKKAVDRLKSFKEPKADENNELNNGEDESKPVLCPFRCNEIVAQCYNWEDIGARTEKVYTAVSSNSEPGLGKREPNFGKILRTLMENGAQSFLIVVSMCHILLRLLEYIRPKSGIEKAKDFPPLQNTSK